MRVPVGEVRGAPPSGKAWLFAGLHPPLQAGGQTLHGNNCLSASVQAGGKAGVSLTARKGHADSTFAF